MTIGAVAPVLAPLLGGAVLQVAGWREIFWILTLIAVLMLVGSFLALPESLPTARRAGSWHATGREALLVLANRHYLGYTLTLVFSYSTLIAYVAASPFVLQVGSGLTPIGYSVVFAVNALGLTLGSLINARLVMRISPRRLLATGLALQLTSVATLALLAVAHRLPLPALLILLWVSVSALGFIAANATSLALEETTQGVGSASAILGAAQFGVAALVAPLVGLAGGSSAAPMAFVMVLAAALALTSFVALTRSRRPHAPMTELP
jgi:DHA1 family bicyclomycin/chloramphenicol resistance-like MFS transporter